MGDIYLVNKIVDVVTNHFTHHGLLDGKSLKVLFDTGANISLMSVFNLPKSPEIVQDSCRVRSVTGQSIKTLGRSKMSVNDVVCKCDFWITENAPVDYIIIGADWIKKHMNCFLRIVGCEKSANEVIKEGKEEDMALRKYENSFGETIEKATPCKLIKHHIDTGSNNPVAKRSRERDQKRTETFKK